MTSSEMRAIPTKRRIKLAVSILLACLAVFQMLHMHIPDEVHEATGVLFGVALVVHIVQHRVWFTALAKGQWSAVRIVNAVVIACLLLCAGTMLVSGLAMSGWAVEAEVHGSGVARAVHLPLVHIGFCLLALHAGLQMHRVFSAQRLQATQKAAAKVLLAAFIVAVAAFAIWSLVDLDFAGYILGTTGFAFIDPSKPIVLSALQYLTIFALFCGIGYRIDWHARKDVYRL